jgi:hypothetical protein
MAKPLKRRISNRHALLDSELAFVRIYTAFGETNAPEAYRRAYLAEGEDEQWYPRTRTGEADMEKAPVDNRTCYRKAQALLATDHINSYIAELKDSTGDLARQQLADTMLFTDDKLSLAAAERVLEDEDKLGFRDAVEQWAEIMCAIGAEVVVPAPGGGEVIVALRELFPHYSESMPPADVIQRTILSLQDYHAARVAADAADAAAADKA